MSPLLVFVRISYRPSLSQVPNKDVRRECPLYPLVHTTAHHAVELLRSYLEFGKLVHPSCDFA